MSDSVDWVALGLDLIGRATRYKSYAPTHDGAAPSAFVSVARLRVVAESPDPAGQPWWWIHAPFLLRLLEGGADSLAPWVSLGRITSRTEQEWLIFFAADLTDAKLERFVRVASFNASEITGGQARDTLLLSTELLHKLMEQRAGTPPSAILLSFGATAASPHPSIMPLTFPPCTPHSCLPFDDVQVGSGEEIPVASLTAEHGTKYIELLERVSDVDYPVPTPGIRTKALAAWNQWVHDLASERCWQQILTVSAGPAATRQDLHAAALIAYLRDVTLLGSLHSCVLGFRAGALAAYDLDDSPAARLVRSVMEAGDFHDETRRADFSRRLKVFLGVEVAISDECCAAVRSLKELRHGNVDLVVAYCLLQNVMRGTVVPDLLAKDASVGRLLKAGSRAIDYCSALSRLFRALIHDGSDMREVTGLSLTEHFLAFTAGFDCTKSTKTDRPSLLSSVQSLLVHQDRSHSPGNTATAIESFYDANPNRSGFRFVFDASMHLQGFHLFLNREGLELRITADNSKSSVFLGYPEAEGDS